METGSTFPFRTASGNINGGTVGLDKLPLETSVVDSAHLPPSPVSDSNDTALTSPVASPPYWVQSHHRSVSNISIETIADGAITLQDNTHGEDPRNNACWAKNVWIEDYVIVNGSRTNIGAFVTWNITVETLQIWTGWIDANSKKIFGIR